MSTTQTTTKAAGRDWAARVRAQGFRVTARSYGSDAVVEISRTFTPGDHAAYIQAESDALHLISEAPAVTYGTTWGTTSDSVGGHAGMTNGHVEILRSGISKRFASGVTA